MNPPISSPRKAAANRRNARQSTSPRTAAGKAAGSLNAVKHGLNTPVPTYIVRACEGQYGDLLNHVRATSAMIDASDLVYAVAARARLRGHRAKLMQMVVEAGLSDGRVDINALRLALTHLSRLETYERKSLSRLGRLLEDRQGRFGETKPRVRGGGQQRRQLSPYWSETTGVPRLQLVAPCQARPLTEQAGLWSFQGESRR